MQTNVPIHTYTNPLGHCLHVFSIFNVDQHSVLNRLNLMFRLFNDRFTFYELENAEKKYMFRDSFFLPLHIFRRHSVNVPDFQSSAYRRKYHYLFIQNISSAYIEKIHINESNF